MINQERFKIKTLILIKNQRAKLIVYFILTFLLVVTISKICRHEMIIADIFLAFKKDSGARALPIKTQAMKTIALRQNLSDVKLDTQLFDNPKLHQRALEYLYPVRINQKSAYIFTDQTDLNNKRCKLLDKEIDIELFQC